jgi:hypothetical protein
MTARIPAEQAVALNGLARGDTLTLHLQMSACHLFDATNGLNLLSTSASASASTSSSTSPVTSPVTSPSGSHA